ncbi:MAG: malonyl-CoA decarboxylase family protein [Actinomycetota bacterium]|nr:malonyl-CoA decarboxylase family protein [Actinomycetota bacterium]
MPSSDVSALVDRRASLLADRDPDDRDELDHVTAELRDALDGRSPRVRRVTADEPGDLVQRLAAAEPVHPISGPEDLADRLDDDRRCFVLEHPLLPGRPLNVVWVALWRGIPDDLSAVLDPSAPTAEPAAADTAAFYSIWNVEPGLVGLPGGRALLGGAVEQLREDLPGLRTFVTLSPIPGFRRWAEDRGPIAEDGHDELLGACATYLITLGDDGRPIDPVARFHMGNGARLFAIARDADRSARGMERSFGIMANYRYEPEDRAANAAALGQGHPALGDTVRRLLDGPNPA